MSKGKIEIAFSDENTKLVIDGEISLFDVVIAVSRVMSAFLKGQDEQVIRKTELLLLATLENYCEADNKDKEKDIAEKVSKIITDALMSKGGIANE